MRWFHALRGRLERGPAERVALGVLVGATVGGVVAIGVAARLAGVRPDTLGSVWWAFLHVGDAGTLAGDDAGWAASLGTCATILGIVFVGAGLNAVTTNLLLDGIRRVRAGRHRVALRGHTLVVGWNPRVFGLVRDLLLADESTAVAVLADVDKEEAEAALDRYVFHAEPRLDVRRDRHRVFFRQGGPESREDLVRAAGDAAARVILLSPPIDDETAGDVATLRAAESVRALVGPSVPCAMEIRDVSVRYHVFLAAGLNPRVDRWVDQKVQRRIRCGEVSCLPEPRPTGAAPPRLSLVHGDEIVARLLAQAVTGPLLGRAWDQILSRADADFHLLDPPGTPGGTAAPPALWDGLWRAIAAGEGPALNARLDGGVVVGTWVQPHVDGDAGPGRLELDPAAWGAAPDRSSLVVLGHRRKGLRLRAASPARAVEIPAPTVDVPDRRYLVLGNNRRLPMLIEQLEEHAHGLGTGSVEVRIVSPDVDVAALRELIAKRIADLARWNERDHRDSRLRADVVDADFTRWEVLRPLLGERWDAVLVLSDERAVGGVHDARAVLALVMLRSFRHCPLAEHRDLLAGASVVVELTDPRSRPLADEVAHDVVVSTDVESQFLAQIARDPRLEEIFRVLIDYADWDLQPRAIDGWTPRPTRWSDVVAGLGSEVPVGYLRGTSVRLAPGLDEDVTDIARVLVVGRT